MIARTIQRMSNLLCFALYLQQMLECCGKSWSDDDCADDLAHCVLAVGNLQYEGILAASRYSPCVCIIREADNVVLEAAHETGDEMSGVKKSRYPGAITQTMYIVEVSDKLKWRVAKHQRQHTSTVNRCAWSLTVLELMYDIPRSGFRQSLHHVPKCLKSVKENGMT